MNAREQRLVALFVGALVVGATWMGYKRLANGVEGMRTETATLTRQAELDQSLVKSYEKPMKAADEWLRTRIANPLSKADAKSQLLLAVQSTAQEAGLPLAPPKLGLPDEERGRYRLARLSAEATGLEKDIYPWLSKFHDPNALRAVLSVEIRPDKKDDTLIQCTIEFGQWYLPDDSEVES